jgi:hypothetical protein
MRNIWLASAAAIFAVSSAAHAQTNLDRMRKVQTTGP